jgi:hypothetical protein
MREELDYLFLVRETGLTQAAMCRLCMKFFWPIFDTAATDDKARRLRPKKIRFIFETFSYEKKQSFFSFPFTESGPRGRKSFNS